MGSESLSSSDINGLLSEIQEMINCDPECQQKKEIELLKSRYETSLSTLASAPAAVSTAQREYIVSAQGQSAWTALQEKTLTDEAQKNVDDFKKTQEEIKINIQRKLDSYGGVLLNYKNIAELYLNYKTENVELVKELKKTSNDILTNERKTYYQDQQSNVLKFYYYYIILWIYIICVIFFGVISFIYPSQTNWKIRFGVFILLILLPFISTWLLGIFIYIIYAIYNMLPKNVYKGHINDSIGLKQNYK